MLKIRASWVKGKSRVVFETGGEKVDMQRSVVNNLKTH